MTSSIKYALTKIQLEKVELCMDLLQLVYDNTNFHWQRHTDIINKVIESNQGVLVGKSILFIRYQTAKITPGDVIFALHALERKGYLEFVREDETDPEKLKISAKRYMYRRNNNCSYQPLQFSMISYHVLSAQA